VWAFAVRGLARRAGRSVLGSELAGIGALLAVGVLWNGIALTHSDPSASSSRNLFLVLPAQIDQLAMGMLLAVVSVAATTGAAGAGRLAVVLARLRRVPGGAWWLAAAATWLFVCFAVGPDGSTGHIDDVGYLARHVLYTLVALLLVAPAALGTERGGAVRRALTWRPVVWVGTISYSVYLWHFAVVAQIGRWWHGAPGNTADWLAWGLAALAGSLVLGAVSHRALEVPSMRLGKWLSRRITRSGGASAEPQPAAEPLPAAGS
jgi:peptidoglycan/LPS O-acetylase OafA/YrhL